MHGAHRVSKKEGARRSKVVWGSLKQRYPPHKANTGRKLLLRNHSFRECMWGLYSQSREYRNLIRGNIFKVCIRTFAPSLRMDVVALFIHPWCQYIKTSGEFSCQCEYRKYSWRIIYVLVSCQGVKDERLNFWTWGHQSVGFALGGFEDWLFSSVFRLGVSSAF